MLWTFAPRATRVFSTLLEERFGKKCMELYDLHFNNDTAHVFEIYQIGNKSSLISDYEYHNR